MPLSERRQIENEMIFRRANERVGDALDSLDAQHIMNGNPNLVHEDSNVIHFKCECSDEDCVARIPIKLSVYKKIHLNRDRIIIKLKHQVKAIEKVITTEDNYCVVEKNEFTTEPGSTLNVTTFIIRKGLNQLIR